MPSRPRPGVPLHRGERRAGAGDHGAGPRPPAPAAASRRVDSTTAPGPRPAPTPPTSPVLPPCGTTGTPAAAQAASTAATSPVLPGRTTARALAPPPPGPVDLGSDARRSGSVSTCSAPTTEQAPPPARRSCRRSGAAAVAVMGPSAIGVRFIGRGRSRLARAPASPGVRARRRISRVTRVGVVTFPGSLDDRDAARAVALAGARARCRSGTPTPTCTAWTRSCCPAASRTGTTCAAARSPGSPR